MAIQKIEINDFLVFKGEFKAEFCDGVNIFIGGNGTGKTTLLKSIYKYPDKLSGSDKILLDEYGKFVEYCPDYNNPESKIKLEIININSSNCEDVFDNMIFIPAINIISYSKGMVAFDDKYKLPFDKSMIDIIKNAQLPELKQNNEVQEKLLKKLEEIINGTVVYENDTFYIQKNSGEKIEFSMEALGYTKFGLLWKLIKNGLFNPRVILIWDEPENSLNPELISTLVEILLELSENGVQIFIATHDYDLARYFDVRKNKNIPVAFHNLIKKDNQIVCNTSNEYLKLNDNLLEKASADLFKAVTADAMEVQDDET
jgi:predicted ATP-dependent endonuclease of OLD family